MSIHTLYAMLFRIWRKKRHRRFLEIVRPDSRTRMLDVGGHPKFWTAHAPCVGEIDTLNLDQLPADAGNPRGHKIRCLIGDGRRLDFDEKSYDVVFSNSVIEHVGAWEDQVAFASELRRVGHALWVQTPAFECPIEPHYLAPFVHYVPRRLRGFVIRWLTPRGLLEHMSRDAAAESVRMTRLLSKREMRALFPDCEIITERVLWFIPKAYIAVRNFR